MFLILSKKIRETIRSPEFKQLIKETHENNIILRQIIKVINTWFARHNQENVFPKTHITNIFDGVTV